MTVSSSVSRADYAGNGATTAFTVPFRFLDPTHLIVYSTVVATGVSTTLVLNSDYTVTGTGGTTGTITCAVAPAVGVNVTILRNVPFTQQTAFPVNGTFPAAANESALDLLTMEVQQLNEEVSRALVSPPGTSSGAALPAPSAGSVIGWNANGTALTNYAASSAVSQASNVNYGAESLATSLASKLGRVVTSIANLRAVPKASYTQAFVTGYYAAGDGGGGRYYYDSADTTTADNGGTVIVAADGGRWKMVVTQSVSIKQFGAKGDGTTDDQPAVQAAVIWCQTNLIPLFVPGGANSTYKLGSVVTISGTNPFVMSGTSINFVPTFNASTTSMTCFSVAGACRVHISDICVQGFGVAVSGSAIDFPGARNANIGSILERIITRNCFNGISGTGLSSAVIAECGLSAVKYAITLASPGDSSFTSNSLSTTSASGVCALITGDPGGSRFENNKCNGTSYGAGFSIRCDLADGDIFFIGNSIEGYTNAAIVIDTVGTAFSNIIIDGNEFAGGGGTSRGVYLPNTTAGTPKNVTMTGNVDATDLGSSIYAATSLTVTGNTIQTGALYIGANVANGVVSGNIVPSGGAGIANNSTSVVVVNNVGFNPVGKLAITPAASPWTYTAGASPETLYLAAATSISQINVNGGLLLPTGTPANTTVTVQLPPFATLITTYTGTMLASRFVH